ncbi:hypothetical protein ACS6ZR_05040 [Streptococcus suis]|uniref:hypothetical protein n=2 Tax=Streptococcus suis TaxID=1307 RepID=UPI0005CF0033|nr:hypothetical protein [Streptococcus suis]MCP8330056.1 hypothetical protein [Streptococcus suis]MCP8380658.1 hypothetical protein [Streptococcus suis]MCP8648680.1 hypothetical protein [Streptococcus suis]MDW8744889.1 hypothetical protein [Streptococcus suis]NQI09739.1 hypothetical protein [Streptococcus suis]
MTSDKVGAYTIYEIQVEDVTITYDSLSTTNDKPKKVTLSSIGDQGVILAVITGFISLIITVVMLYYRKSENAYS